MTEIVLDSLLLAMLVATVVWCVVLHRRLRRVAGGHGELQALVAALATATDRAEAAARSLGGTLLRAQELQEREAGEVEARSGELARLLATAGRVTERLEAGVTQAMTVLAEARTRAEPATRPAPRGKTVRAASPSPVAGRGRSPARAATVAGAGA